MLRRAAIAAAALAAIAVAPARAGVATPDSYTSSPGIPVWMGITEDGYGMGRTELGIWEGGFSAPSTAGFAVAADHEALTPGACWTGEDYTFMCHLAQAGGAPFAIHGTDVADIFREVSCSMAAGPCPRTWHIDLGGGNDEVHLWHHSSAYDNDTFRWVSIRPTPMAGIVIDGGAGNDAIGINGGPGSGRIDGGPGDDQIYTRGGYDATEALTDGPFEITCGDGNDTVDPGPNDVVGLDCEHLADDAGQEPGPDQNDVGMVCGRARFAFHQLNVSSDDDFVRKGERVCMLAASNRMSREIIGLGGGVATAIVAQFGREIAKQLDKRAQRKAAQRNLKKRGYRLLRKLLPDIGRAVLRVNRIERAAEAAAVLMIPYAAGKHLQHVRAYHGCTRLLIDVDRGRPKVSGGLLYSPDGLEDPGADAELTYASVYRKHARRLRLDKWERVASGLHCDEDGFIRSDGADTALFEDAERIALSWSPGG